jgi:hypothetical protein
MFISFRKMLLQRIKRRRAEWFPPTARADLVRFAKSWLVEPPNRLSNRLWPTVFGGFPGLARPLN